MEKKYVVPIDFMEHSVSARMFLKPRLQKVYWNVVEAVASMKVKINVPLITKEEWWFIAKSVAFDHPQFFYWKDWSVRFTPTVKGSEVITAVSLIYRYNKEEAQKKLTQIDRLVDQMIAKCICKGMSERQMIYSVHNYLAKTITYTKEKDPEGSQDYPDRSYTLETLLNRDGVCRGVSISNVYILRRLQIECSMIESEDHAWNIFKLSTGEILFSDTTWDINHQNQFQYFLLTEKEMSRNKSHKVTELYPKKIVNGS